MEVVTGAMGTLLPKLADLLTEEYNLQKGVRGEIMFLKAEMESMEIALLKISEAPIDQPPDIQVKLWAKDVRDLSYDLEDNIDRFMVRIESHEPEKPHSLMGYINRSLNLLTKGKIRHKIGIDIKDIKSRMKEVSDRRDRYKVDNVVVKNAESSTDSLRQLAFFKKATELIGTDVKSRDIVKMLMEGDDVSKKQVKMVAVVGFGGLGKTTLANVVYEKLKVKFDCEAFVSVSLNPNMEKVFKNLLHQLDKDKYKDINEATWGEVQLISEIREFLRNKRYFILIDDVWDKYVWKNIRCALIENECGSRVIATTRIVDVAEEVGGVYRLRPLSTVDSRKLFYQKVFGSEDKCPPIRLAEVCENIIQKCGGVPLAIITLASMLASKKGHENTHTYWSKVYQSMGSGLVNNPELKNMRRILYVSYYDLPPHLKTCLLYLSLYPEDYKINTKELIWKWIGEGFVHEEQGKSLCEVGEGYIDELINKSLIQPIDIDIAKKASSCRVHDMMLDLITSLSNEENFITTLRGQQPMSRGGAHGANPYAQKYGPRGFFVLPPHKRTLCIRVGPAPAPPLPMSVPSKVRRLSLQTSEEEDVEQLPTMSLSYVRSLTVFGPASSLLSALQRFLVLRALDLSGCKEVDNHHCKDICNLFHLRYLSLKGTSITEIPKEIRNLRFLQVLDIRYTRMKKLPSTFVQLRALVLVDMCDRMVSTLLLRSMSSLSSLSSLAISIERLGEEELQALGNMPSLCDLSITTQGRDEGLVIDNGCPFRCLTRFSVTCRNFDLLFAQGAMQKLRILQLEFDVVKTYHLFGDFDFGLENLPSLEHVYVKPVGHRWNSMCNSLQKVLDINPNKPILKVEEVSVREEFFLSAKLLLESRRELSIEE